ncbi:hypothetical protein UFOVP55_47 [uncultured Caudovirales phage]|uniref:Uncharacterized protein n=1 Tax=uncultured Caudovirales phage TaxID=2100421 RepID=A0A6J5KR94_9CAUD|nr:hypothetical protein UFOVP55_47 [uncultured Caudovirales phage]
MKYIEPWSREMWIDFAKYAWRQIGVTTILSIIIGYLIGAIVGLLS